MDKDKAILLAAQAVVFAGLVALVALGHNGGIQTAMLLVAGSITGVNAYDTVKTKLKK